RTHLLSNNSEMNGLHNVDSHPAPWVRVCHRCRTDNSASRRTCRGCKHKVYDCQEGCEILQKIIPKWVCWACDRHNHLWETRCTNLLSYWCNQPKDSSCVPSVE